MKKIIKKFLEKSFLNKLAQFILFFTIAFFISVPKITFALENQLIISGIKNGDKRFVLSENGRSAPLFISSKDCQGVKRALKDFQEDIGKVTNTKPDISMDKIPSRKEIVIVGTLGKSSIIDDLVKNKKINIDSITGKWEAYLIQVVENPVKGVDRALVITGSDKRGTIYGIYKISEKIGVSPWYWWADVPIKKQTVLYINSDFKTISKPAVKYRGIFLNDEAPSLTGWAQEKFGGLNHKFYEHVFELILRLKGNYLWPAMWGNNFDDDDSLNQKLADEYGVVMGTSHHEPMMRSWKEWPKYGKGDWNYQTNDSALREFWREGIKRMNSYESIATLGMRGNGDEAMSQTANIGLLEKIISDQRKILGDVTGKDVTSIPQVWALYKEVQDYYDKGMRVPDDVTLLLCDDNWGNIRKLPLKDAKPRKGGYGIYYHFDYVGGPRNYKWLNTTQIERVWEQMHLAYEYGVNRIWIVNVGDLKQMEFPISFFLDYAWNPVKWTADRLPEYYHLWAEQQFGEKYAAEIGSIISKYTKYNSRRKPELLSPDTYSLANYLEAERVVGDYNKLAKEAQDIYNLLPSEYKAAFYQVVLYPVAACANLNDLYITAGLNHLYGEQGRAATDSLANKVKELFNKDAELSNYYNKEMENGKWDHMMDQTHIGYTYWQQPDNNNMPKIDEIEIPRISDMGVALENSKEWMPEDGNTLTLPEFDRYNQQSYDIEIFNRGSIPFKYSINTTEPWIKTSSSNGTINKQKRLWVNIDWDKAPSGINKSSITISGPENKNFVVQLEVNNNSFNEEINGFVESNGYISIEAEHYSKAVDGSNIKWRTILNLGRTNSAVEAFPVTSAVQTPGGDSPHLEYNIYLQNKGEVKVEAYFSPTLNFHNSPQGIRYAVSLDDGEPQIINMTPNPYFADLNRDQTWNKWVSENINVEISKLEINKPGKHILKFWMVDPGPALQKIVIDAGGVKPSYLGPPESFHKNVNMDEAGL
jgi:Glycosyl hydrolase family 115/Gylcosyl hydrolase family 115 C-terminal domain